MKNYVPTKEWMTYAIGALGQGMVYAIMSSYISDFYLNVMKLTPLFVLLLVLLARIWDAAIDPVLGYYMDRANPKHGKLKSDIIYTPRPIAVLTVLLFYSPDFSGGALMAYAVITYLLWSTVYSVSDVPFWSLPNLMSPNPDERGAIISKARTANGVGSAIPMAFFMLLGFSLPLFNLSGTQLEETKYMTITLFCAIVGNILFVPVYFKTKERVNLPPPPKKKKGEKGIVKIIFGCKPLILTALMGILSAARYLYQAGAVHVARYAFYIGKDPSGLTGAEREAALQSNISLVSTVFQVAAAAGMFLTMLVMPLVFKKFNYKQIIISTSVLGAASSLIIYFIGYENFWACVPFFVISCIPLGAINVCAFAMIGDCLDYMEWKTGKRTEGVTFSMQTMFTKISSGITAGLAALALHLLDYKAVEGASVYVGTQSAAFDQWIWPLVILTPAIASLLYIVPLLFIRYTPAQRATVESELAARRAAQENAKTE